MVSNIMDWKAGKGEALHQVAGVHLYSWKHRIKWPRSGLKPRPLDPNCNALAIRTLRFKKILGKVRKNWISDCCCCFLKEMLLALQKLCRQFVVMLSESALKRGVFLLLWMSSVVQWNFALKFVIGKEQLLKGICSELYFLLLLQFFCPFTEASRFWSKDPVLINSSRRKCFE